MAGMLKNGSPDSGYWLAQVESIVANNASSTAVTDAYAQLVDAAWDEGNEANLVRAIELASAIFSLCEPKDACLVLYYQANAWDALRRIRTTEGNAWIWEQPELLYTIHWLRAAVQHEGYQSLGNDRRGQIHCNLGNALSSAGRFVEALEEWLLALAIHPILAMAHGNLGKGFYTYARQLYDDGQMYWLFRRAREALSVAIKIGLGRDGATFPAALESFAQHHAYIDALVKQGDDYFGDELREFSLGRSKDEQEYRRWALEKNLFLNPMNDAYNHSVAASDVLSLPNHSAQRGITFLAFYNQLKQEYGYARWCLFQGATSGNIHYADRKTELTLNGDMARYSIGLEQVRTAFRCAYSLLDKVAYFINDYWELGVPEKRVSFRTIWFEEKKKPQDKPRPRKEFYGLENLPLRGLFWLAKDIYEKELKEVAAPDAKELDEFRNHLEHKYVKVVDDFVTSDEHVSFCSDHLAHLVRESDLLDKAERLLKLSRSALIYLSLAMHVKEQQEPVDNEFIIQMMPSPYPDSLKR